MTSICSYIKYVAIKVRNKISNPTQKYYVEVYDVHGKHFNFKTLPRYKGQDLELIIYAKSLRRSKAYALWKEVSYAGHLGKKGISTITFVNAKTRAVEQTFYGFSISHL